MIKLISKKTKLNFYRFLLKNKGIKNMLLNIGLLPMHIISKLRLYEQFCDIADMNPNRKKAYAVNMVARLNNLSPLIVSQTIDEMHLN